MSKISSRKIAVWALAAVVLTVPVLTFAQNVPGGSSEGSLGNIVTLAQSVQRIIGIFVIAMIWGLVAFLGNTLGVNNSKTGTVPTVKGTTGITP